MAGAFGRGAGVMRRAALRIWARLPAWLTARLAWVLAAKINVGVCAIMFHGTDEVLLAAHPYKPMAPWQLPGGYLHAGEQPAAGLGRELQEELGLTLERYQLVYAEALPRHMTLFYVVKASGTFRSSP